MRELKYRVYDKTEKCYSDKAFSIDQLGICYVQDEDGYWEEIDEERYIVEQYTGLKDENGKMIFEGDVVGIPDNEEDGIEAHVFGAVVYDKNKFGVKGESPFAGEDIHFFDIWDGLEVIGNIHENPELLEGK